MTEKVYIYEGVGRNIYAHILPKGTIIGGIENWYASNVTAGRGLLALDAKNLEGYSDEELTAKGLTKENSSVLHGLQPVVIIEIQNGKPRLIGNVFQAKVGTKVALALED